MSNERSRPWVTGTRLQIIAVIIATVVGLWLRVYRLGHEPLASLEIYTWDFSHQTLPFIFDRLAHIETNPPFYYLLIKLVMKLGESETLLRLPSALAGALSIPLIYVLGRIGGAPFSGAMGAGLMALSTMNITYSRLARCFSLTQVCCLLVAIATVIIIDAYVQRNAGEQRNNRRETLGWIMFTVASVFGFYLHYTFILEIFVMQCIILLTWIINGRWYSQAILKWIVSLIALALCLSWGLELARTQAYSEDINWMQAPTLSEAARLLFQVYGYTQLYRFQPWTSLLFILFSLIGFLVGWKRSTAVLVSGSLFVLFPIVLYVISQVRPVFIERVLIPTSFSAYLLAAYGCAVCLQASAEYFSGFLPSTFLQKALIEQKVWKFAAIVILLGPAWVSARNGLRAVQITEPYDQAAEYLASAVKPGDVAAGADGVIYYERKIGGKYPYFKVVYGNSSEAQVTFGSPAVPAEKVVRLAPVDRNIYLVLRDRLKSSAEIRAKIGHQAPAIVSFSELGIYRVAGACPVTTTCLDDVEGMNSSSYAADAE
jgi:hypothetical protein